MMAEDAILHLMTGRMRWVERRGCRKEGGETTSAAVAGPNDSREKANLTLDIMSSASEHLLL